MPSPDKPSKPVVLVVEDEPIVLLHALDLVGEAGLEAIYARNADEALEILESRDDIRIVFTDIEMPGSLDGLKLAAAVRNRWPPIEIIVASGRHSLAKGDLPARGRFFSKPYNVDKLIGALQELGGVG